MLTLLTNDLLSLTAASTVAIAAAVRDFSVRRIPNTLTGGGLTYGIILHGLRNGICGAETAILAALLASGLFLVIYIAGGMGAGDVKLMAAVGSLAGPHAIQVIVTSAVVIGALFALVIALYRRQLGQTLRNTLVLFDHHRVHGLQPHHELNVKSETGLRMPFALPIAAGCLVSLGLRIAQ